MEPTFSKDELKLCFDALTVFIRSDELKQEQAAEVERLWNKLRWLCTYPDLANDGVGELLAAVDGILEFLQNPVVKNKSFSDAVDRLSTARNSPTQNAERG